MIVTEFSDPGSLPGLFFKELPRDTTLRLHRNAEGFLDFFALLGSAGGHEVHLLESLGAQSLGFRALDLIWVVLYSRVGFKVLFIRGAVLYWGLRKGPEFREPPTLLWASDPVVACLGQTRGGQRNEGWVMEAQNGGASPTAATFKRLVSSWP